MKKIENVFSIYRNKRILISGNTGFKGSWMSEWLLKLGANVSGYALEPPTNPSLYDQLQLRENTNQCINDIRDYDQVKKFIKETNPEIIFHFAAQPLVRESYKIPLETFDVNIMGTINVLEAVRELGMRTIIVCITSDKSYENQETLMGYREDDPMGGHDPYSASKGAAELVISSYRRSFFSPEAYQSHGVKIASVRAGNVIGGGDWAKDRIVPDCIKYLMADKDVFVRNPVATRPWQHVLEPLGGYLLLGAKLFDDNKDESLYCDAFNFGPLVSSNKSVENLVEEIIKNWGKGSWYHKSKSSYHEASLLNLSIDKAFHLLNWQPIWDFETTVKNTVDWYSAKSNGENIKEITDKQIDQYQKSMVSSEGIISLFSGLSPKLKQRVNRVGCLLLIGVSKLGEIIQNNIEPMDAQFFTF